MIAKRFSSSFSTTTSAVVHPSNASSLLFFHFTYGPPLFGIITVPHPSLSPFYFSLARSSPSPAFGFRPVTLLSHNFPSLTPNRIAYLFRVKLLYQTNFNPYTLCISMISAFWITITSCFAFTFVHFLLPGSFSSL